MGLIGKVRQIRAQMYIFSISVKSIKIISVSFLLFWQNVINYKKASMVVMVVVVEVVLVQVMVEVIK